MDRTCGQIGEVSNTLPSHPAPSLHYEGLLLQKRYARAASRPGACDGISISPLLDDLPTERTFDVVGRILMTNASAIVFDFDNPNLGIGNCLFGFLQAFHWSVLSGLPLLLGSPTGPGAVNALCSVFQCGFPLIDMGVVEDRGAARVPVSPKESHFQLLREDTHSKPFKVLAFRSHMLTGKCLGLGAFRPDDSGSGSGGGGGGGEHCSQREAPRAAVCWHSAALQALLPRLTPAALARLPAVEGFFHGDFQALLAAAAPGGPLPSSSSSSTLLPPPPSSPSSYWPSLHVRTMVPRLETYSEMQGPAAARRFRSNLKAFVSGADLCVFANSSASSSSSSFSSSPTTLQTSPGSSSSTFKNFFVASDSLFLKTLLSERWETSRQKEEATMETTAASTTSAPPSHSWTEDSGGDSGEDSSGGYRLHYFGVPGDRLRVARSPLTAGGADSPLATLRVSLKDQTPRPRSRHRRRRLMRTDNKSAGGAASASVSNSKRVEEEEEEEAEAEEEEEEEAEEEEEEGHFDGGDEGGRARGGGARALSWGGLGERGNSDITTNRRLGEGRRRKDMTPNDRTVLQPSHDLATGGGFGDADFVETSAATALFPHSFLAGNRFEKVKSSRSGGGSDKNAAKSVKLSTANDVGVGGTITQFLTLIEFWLLSRSSSLVGVAFFDVRLALTSEAFEATGRNSPHKNHQQQQQPHPHRRRRPHPLSLPTPEPGEAASAQKRRKRALLGATDSHGEEPGVPSSPGNRRSLVSVSTFAKAAAVLGGVERAAAFAHCVSTGEGAPPERVGARALGRACSTECGARETVPFL